MLTIIQMSNGLVSNENFKYLIMKFSNITFSKIYILAIALLMWSCGDEKQFFEDVDESSGTRLRFIHAATNLQGQTASSIRSLNIFVNDTKITASPLAYAATYPLNDYVAFDNPSSVNIKTVAPSLAATTTAAEIPELTVTTSTIETIGYYTVAIVGTGSIFEAVAISDDLSTTPYDGRTYVRLVNLISNSTNLSLVGTPPKVNASDPTPSPITIAESIPFKQASAFVALPLTGAYTNVQIKDATTGTVIATLVTGSSTFQSYQVYSLYARGEIGVTGTKSPTISRNSHR